MNPFTASIDIAAPVEDVFAALRDPQRLARWWGPAGFTNTFNAFEFKTGGRWSLVMHGPGSGHYPSENVFVQIEAPRSVVIQHTNEPNFTLTIGLTASKAGTRVSWSQAFESEEVARRLEPIVVPANAQNLERLSAEVLRAPERP